MATLLEIWRTGGGAYVDYSSWLYDLPVKTHSLNQPQTLEFSLTNGVAGLVAPEAGNRVRLTTAAWGVAFVGYCVSTPELEVLGADKTGAGVYGYKVKCADDSLRLQWNCSAVFPALAPFINQYQGQIVKGLIAALGGGFTTTNVDNGILVPYFRVKPDESFWDAVRRLSDRTNMKLWFLNGAASYKSYGDSAFSPAPNESDAAFSPPNLSISPVDNPVFNDVTGTGNPEPQTFAREHFVGDGITATFPLKLVPFGAASSLLNVDDWTEAAVDANKWTETDVNSLIAPYAGSLKFAGGPVATPSRITAVQGLEIAGKLELRAGRFRFSAPSNAIVGGLFASDTGALADCVAGFRCTPSGGVTSIQPIVNGAVVGPAYGVSSGKSYNFVIVVDCSQAVRRRRPFFSLATSFGGENVAADARVSFYLLEIVDGAPDSLSNSANTVISYTATISNIAQFLLFTLLSGPLNGTDSVNMVVNFTSLHKPVQCEVWTMPKGASSWKRERLGDKAQPDIRCAVVATQQTASVVFVAGQEPAVGERVRVIYRGAGLARARVQKATSITAEATKAGDSGVRAGTLPSQQPAARDSQELERQIQAYVDDATTPLYKGTWTFDSKLYSVAALPVPGRVLTVTATSRYAAFNALVTDVKQTFECFDKDGTTEVFRFDVTFGPLSRLADEQENFLPAEDAATGPLDSVTQMLPIDTVNVGTVFGPDLAEADFDLTLAPTTLEIDAGRSPSTSYDVRRTDSAWGSQSTLNQVSTPVTRTFTVPRTSRDTVVFVKDVATGASDNFDRADGGLGANWTQNAQFQTLSISGNCFKTDAAGQGLYRWNAASFSADQFSQVTVKGTVDGGAVGPAVRIILTDTGTFYIFRGNSSYTQLWKFVSGAYTQLGSTGAAVTVNDVMRLEVQGNSLAAKVNGTVRISATDSAIASGGAGIYGWTVGNTRGDDWSAGGLASGGLSGISRYPSLVRVVYPLVPNQPLAQFDWSDTTNIKIKIDPAILVDQNAFGFEVRAKDNATVLRSYGYLILTDADLTINLTDIVKLSARDASAKGGLGADAFLVSRSLDFYVYAWNLVGEYSASFHLVGTVPTPALTGLQVDETNGKLVWTATDADRYKVEVATDSGYANIILTKTVSDQFLSLDGDNLLRARWFRVTPGDEIGWGSAVTASFAGSNSFVGSALEVDNPNFEASGALPPPGWMVDTLASSVTGVATLSYDTTTQYSGVRSLVVAADASHSGGAAALKKYACRPGDVFRISCRGKVSSGNGNGSILLSFRASDGSYVGGAYASFSGSSWVFTSGSAIAPASTVYATLELVADIAQTAEFDNIHIARMQTSFEVTPINTATTPTGGNPLTATTGGTANHATISVAASTMQYGDGQVNYNSGSIETLLDNTKYYVYADDPGYAGGAVTFQASTHNYDVSGANGRVYFGSITTPTFGGGGTGGSGGGNGSCFSANARVRKFPAGSRPISEWVDGDLAKTRAGWRPARLIVHEHEEREMLDMGDGELVTPGHHFWHDGAWRPASEVFESRCVLLGQVYNLAVDGETDDEHCFELANGRTAHNVIKAAGM